MVGSLIDRRFRARASVFLSNGRSYVLRTLSANCIGLVHSLRLSHMPNRWQCSLRNRTAGSAHDAGNTGVEESIAPSSLRSPTVWSIRHRRWILIDWLVDGPAAKD